MPTLGPFEVSVILVIVVVIFGGGRIGELGGAVGRTIREFRSSVKGEEAPIAAPAPTTVTIHESPPTVAATPAPTAPPVSAAPIVTPPSTEVIVTGPGLPPTQVIIEPGPAPVYTPAPKP